jgi:HPr kinase/phosphorylase
MDGISIITIDKLFRENTDVLDLTWRTGKDGGRRSLTSESLHKANSAPIGHLNLVHPNRVQVLGGPELEYLRKLSADALEEALHHLFTEELAAAIVADGELPPIVLEEAASKTGTPLLVSTHSSPEVVAHLGHYLMQNLAEATVVHGVFMEVTGVGVLIQGEAAVGKSELALELVTRGHRLVADDAVELRHVAPETLEGACPAMLRDFLEVRGLGILNIRSLFGETAVKLKKNLRLIVQLVKPGDNPGQLSRLEMEASQTSILGVNIPTVRIPVAAGRNLAVLLEVAVRNHILISRGIDPTAELMARQQYFMQEES